jgi:hypothetical protein
MQLGLGRTVVQALFFSIPQLAQTANPQSFKPSIPQTFNREFA